MNIQIPYRSKSVWFISIHIAIGVLLSCYLGAALNISTENVSWTLNWEKKSIFIPISNGLYYTGNLIGSVLANPYSRFYGRRALMVHSHLLIILGSCFSILPFTLTFCLGRFITGISSGSFISITTIYLKESAPEEIVVKIGTLFEIAATGGFLLIGFYGLTLPTEDYSGALNYLWMFIFFFPALVSSYLLYFFKTICVHDTPSWYLSKGSKENAAKALSMIYYKEHVDEALHKLEEFLKALNENKEKLTYKAMIADRKYRKMLRLSVLLCIIQQFSGIIPIMIYSTTIFQEIGGSTMAARILNLLACFINFLSSIAVIPLVKHFSRKNLILTGQVLLIIDLFLLVFFTCSEGYGVIPPAICIFLYLAIFAFSLGSSIWAFLGECSNDIAISLGALCGTIIIVVLAYSFPLLIELIGISYCFLLFAVILIFSWVYEYFDIPSAKGLSKSQISTQLLIS